MSHGKYSQGDKHTLKLSSDNFLCLGGRSSSSNLLLRDIPNSGCEGDYPSSSPFVNCVYFNTG